MGSHPIFLGAPGRPFNLSEPQLSHLHNGSTVAPVQGMAVANEPRNVCEVPMQGHAGPHRAHGVLPPTLRRPQTHPV